jgi:uncharacterized protein
VGTALPINHLDRGIELPVSFTASSGIVTTGIYTQPNAPTHRAVILCHGFLSNKNSQTNRRLTELLIPKSIATLRFDWYGMGESPESFARISIKKCEEQLDAAFRFLAESNINSLGVVGSSFGGFIALLFASRHPQLHALGLKCPVVDFPEVLRLEFREDAIERWKHTDRIPNILGGEHAIFLPYSFFEECLTYDGYASASRIHTSTLIVHGSQDELIPSHQIDRLLAALHVPTQVKLIPGANHQFGRPEDFRLMTNHLANWMHEHVSIV